MRVLESVCACVLCVLCVCVRARPRALAAYRSLIIIICLKTANLATAEVFRGVR